MKYFALLGLAFSLSAHAQNRHAEMEAKLQAACGTDVASLCVETRGRDKFRCLRENQDQLSETCRAFVARAPKHGRPPGPPPEGEGAGSAQ